MSYKTLPLMPIIIEINFMPIENSFLNKCQKQNEECSDILVTLFAPNDMFISLGTGRWDLFE